MGVTKNTQICLLLTKIAVILSTMKNSVSLDRGAVEQARRQALLTVGGLQVRTRLSQKTVWLARTGKPVGLAAAKKLAKALRVPLRRLLLASMDGGGAEARAGGDQPEQVKVQPLTNSGRAFDVRDGG